MWMATFSDLVTLLLTFFVMLMAMANFEDTVKVEAVMLSIREALGADGWNDLVLAHGEAMTEDTRHEDAVVPTEARLREAFDAHISDDLIRMVDEDRDLRVRLDERVFFKPGSAVLHPTAYDLLADVGAVLKDANTEVRVEGHADKTGDELANWRLSSERALAVVMALRERGPVPGDRLIAVAYGSFVPGVSIGEDAGWNRRVELVLQAEDSAGAASALELYENRRNHE